MRACRWRISRGAVVCLVLVGLIVLFGRSVVAVAAADQEQNPDSEDGIVRGVLFYAPTCPHCHVVINEVLPPIRDEYGRDLVIAEVDTTSVEGRPVWQAAVALYNPSVVGVPTLVIGEHVLIGSRQIPEELPGIVRNYLNEGGVGWPAVTGLDVLVQGLERASAGGTLRVVLERFGRDVLGNGLSLLVLLGLVAGLVAVIRPRPWQMVWSERAALYLLVPLVLGLGVSLYLAQVETSGTEAVCGPVGDCNAVQQSEFALLFGVLHVAVLGVIGYIALLLTYSLWLLSRGSFRRYLPGATFAMAFFGLGFAAYLTFLEPFVIGATCMWCLTQSVCMLAVALLTAGPGWASLREVGQGMGLLEKPAREHRQKAARNG